jgi:hypothetical protein
LPATDLVKASVPAGGENGPGVLVAVMFPVTSTADSPGLLGLSTNLECSLPVIDSLFCAIASRYLFEQEVLFDSWLVIPGAPFSSIKLNVKVLALCLHLKIVL